MNLLARSGPHRLWVDTKPFPFDPHAFAVYPCLAFAPLSLCFRQDPVRPSLAGETVRERHEARASISAHATTAPKHGSRPNVQCDSSGPRITLDMNWWESSAAVSCRTTCSSYDTRRVYAHGKRNKRTHVFFYFFFFKQLFFSQVDFRNLIRRYKGALIIVCFFAQNIELLFIK